MPRKPRVRSRRPGSRPGSTTSPGASQPTPRPARRRDPRVFWQCQACGAPVEPQFGAGDDSWCPSCHANGTVAGMEGQYPSPARYGAWAALQARLKAQEKTRAELTDLMHQYRPPTTPKEELMKRTKTHTGTFHCPSCFTEVELVNEESLKCDKCKGPLAQGSLDEIWTDEDDEED